MKTFARIQNDVVVELLAADTLPDFHPDLQWVQCSADVQEGYIYKNGSFAAPAIDTEAVKKALVASVDSAVAAVYATYTRFEVEYLEREKQAQAYKDAGYAGEMPQQVAAFAAPTGKTGKQAADTILAQAAQLRGALAQLGVLRMRKFEVKAAATAAEAQTLADSIIAQIQQIGAAL